MSPAKRTLFALIGLLLGLCSAVQAQVLPCNTWTGAASDRWEDASNWSFGHVPNSSEDARIANGAHVIASGSITCSSLYLSNGTLRVSGDVNLFTADIGTGTVFTFTSTASRKVTGSIGAHGTIVWEGGDIDGQMNGSHFSAFNLHPGSIFIDQANGAVMRNNLTMGLSGTYRKQAGISEIAVPLSTGGLIEANAGEVAFQKLASVHGSARINAAAGAVCKLSCATNEQVDLGASSQFNGVGQIVLDGYFSGSINGAVSFRRRFGGFLTIPAGSSVHLESNVGSACSIDGVTVNQGTIVWKGGRLETAPATLPAWGRLINESGGIFECRASDASSIAINLFTNNGTLRKIGPAELTLGSLQNNGLLQVTAGTLLVTDLEGNNGEVHAASGTKAEFRTSGNSATLDVNSTFTGGGDIALNGVFIGILRGRARLHKYFDGNLTVAAGSSLTISEPASTSLLLKGSVVVGGTLLWTSGGISGNPTPPIRGIETTDTGRFEIHADAAYGPDLMLTNRGTLAKTAGIGTTMVSAVLSNSGLVEAKAGTLAFSAGISQQAGSTRLAGGDLRVGTPYGGSFVGGTLAGRGTITGDVYLNGGTLLLDEPPGQSLHIIGNLTFNHTSTVTVAAISAEPAGCGRVVVDGAASLAGTLTFTTRGGYAPAWLARFPILTAGSIAGTFTTYSFPTPPATTHYAMSYGPTLAEITLVPPPFPGWQYAHFGAETDPAIIGEMADPDGDGAANLLEYAFGSDPTSPSSRADLTVFLRQDTHSALSYLCGTYQTPADATDIEVIPEVSSDLVTWNSGPLYITERTQITADGVRTVTVQTFWPVDYTRRSFVRVRVRRLR